MTIDEQEWQNDRRLEAFFQYDQPYTIVARTENYAIKATLHASMSRGWIFAHDDGRLFFVSNDNLLKMEPYVAVGT